MLRLKVLAILLFVIGGILSASSQTVPSSGDLVFKIPGLYGQSGLLLPNSFHQAHFNSSFQENFSPLNSELGTELTRLPLASPASGFVYTFDKALGVWNQTTQSFGPILSERSETIGRRKLFLGFGYQYFGFSTLDGIDLHKLPAVFAHNETPPAPTYEQDYITTLNDLDLTIHQFTFFATYGVTNRLDVSVAIPFEQTNLTVTSAAHIVRIAPPDPVFGQAHYFDANDKQNSINKTFLSSGSASGIGDVVFRAKYNAWRGERSGVAVGMDVRTPTGDEMNLLGSGAPGVRPFVAYSYRARISPHANFGFEWNGRSVLAGNAVTQQKGKLPNNVYYSGGVDVGVNKHLSAAFDLIGLVSINSDKITRGTYTGADGSTAATFETSRGNVPITSGSVGLKVNPWKNLLVNGNVLIKLDDGGLRAPVVPYVGISYTF